MLDGRVKEKGRGRDERKNKLKGLNKWGFWGTSEKIERIDCKEGFYDQTTWK